MKAEHRKELQTNALADSLGRLIQHLKNLRNFSFKDVHAPGYRPTGTVLLIGAAVLVVAAAIVAYIVLTKTSTTKSSAEWVRIDQAANLEDLDSVIQQNASSQPTRDARFIKARYLFTRGQSHLYARDFGKNPEDVYKEALKDLEDATALYQKLADECKDSPLLAQEALMNAASASVMQNKWDDATKYYNDLVKRYPNCKDADTARDQLKLLESADQRKQLEEMHAFLADPKYFGAPVMPPMGGANGFPGGMGGGGFPGMGGGLPPGFSFPPPPPGH